MEEFSKKQRMCPREPSHGTENEMLNQPKRRSQRILGLQKNGDCHLPKKPIPMGSTFQADLPDWTGSQSINKQCSYYKDEESPQKMGLEEGYGEHEEDGDPNFWWDDNDEAFAFRYNKDVSYIPQQTVSEVPCAILDRLFSNVDRKTLGNYTYEDLIRLQNQMSFGSAMVAKYISDVAQSRLCSLKVKERENKKLRQNNDHLDKKLRLIENELNKERNKFLEEKNKLLEEIEEFKVKIASDKLELQGMCSEGVAFRKEVKELKESCEASKVMAEDLKKELGASDVASTSSMSTFKKVVNIYKSSKEYMCEMGDFGEHGFNLLKKILVKNGHVDESLINTYSYLGCIESDVDKTL